MSCDKKVCGCHLRCKTRIKFLNVREQVEVVERTTLKPANYQTNHLLISQKSHRYFPEDIFYEPQHFPCPSRAKREIGAFFDVPARFRISPYPLHSSLPCLIADYNPSHKLLTQLRTLTNFLRRLGLTMLHWKFYEC